MVDSEIGIFYGSYNSIGLPLNPLVFVSPFWNVVERMEIIG